MRRVVLCSAPAGHELDASGIPPDVEFTFATEPRMVAECATAIPAAARVRVFMPAPGGCCASEGHALDALRLARSPDWPAVPLANDAVTVRARNPVIDAACAILLSSATVSRRHP